MYILKRIIFTVVFVLGVIPGAVAQTKSFTPVEGANLKAKIDNAVTQGRAQGRFWVGYQFEVRPGVAIDFRNCRPQRHWLDLGTTAGRRWMIRVTKHRAGTVHVL